MHEIYELKEMLCEELEKYGKKGELSTGSLDIIDKLAHTVKNLGKIIKIDEEDGASYMYDGSYRGGRDGYVYARRRDNMGRYSRRGYSRADDMIDQLKDLMEDAPDEKTKQEIHKLVTKLEQM